MKQARLEFLDGVRGLAALYVMLHHAYTCITQDQHAEAFSERAHRFLAPADYGPIAVVIFIVLSGFCLMLPVVNSPDRNLRGGLMDYFYRRAKRILPPYWVALAASLALIACVPALQHTAGESWDGAVPVTLGGTLAHIFLLHDLNARYFTMIDPPMWSVAIEWHIYFFFPLLLLVWRKMHIGAAVLLAAILGYLPHRLSHGTTDFAHTHYIGLFAIGMAACWIAVSKEAAAEKIRSQLPFPALCIVLSGLAAVAVAKFHGQLAGIGAPDYMLALAAGALLICCVLALRHHDTQPSLLLRITEAPWLAHAGRFSYSLYLIHVPLLAAAYVVIGPHIASPIARLAIMWFAVCPAIIGLSFLFFRAFELPFMRKRPSEPASSATPPAPTPETA